MKLFATILFLCFLSVQTVWGQKPNFLPYMSFSSEYEREAWTNTEKDYLHLFSSIDSTSTLTDVKAFRKRLEDFLALHPTQTEGKKRSRDLMNLYVSVHEEFLMRYRSIIYFPELMRKGEFNCVTSTVLYAIILDHFKIPYVIIEEPNHVYLIAYPENEYHVLETTTSNLVGFSVSEKEKKFQVNRALQNKRLTQEEVDSLGLNRSYEATFPQKKRVTMDELLAFHFINEMAKMEQDKNIDFPVYFNYALKASQLLPETSKIDLRLNELALHIMGKDFFRNDNALSVWLLTLTDKNFQDESARQIANGIVVSNVKLESTYLYDEDEYDLERDYKDAIELEQKFLAIPNAPKWRKTMLTQFYKAMLYDFDLEDEQYDEMLLRFSELDPQNSFVLEESESRMMEELMSKIRMTPQKADVLFQAFQDSILQSGASFDTIRYEMNLFQHLETVAKGYYLSKRRKEGDEVFTQILKIYQRQNILKDEYQSSNAETLMAFLYLHRADAYEYAGDYATARKILKEGHDLLPENKAVTQRYQGSIKKSSH